MKTISLDIETISSIDLTKCGLYKYAESPDFEILLFGYSVDGGDAVVVDIKNGETVPQDIINALTDENILKFAFNANFERICLSRWLGVPYLSPVSWRCTMVWCAYMGLPLSLEGVGAVLGLDKQKLTEGKNLIRKFCVPQETEQLLLSDDTEWELFREYNRRDVEVEMAIQAKLAKFPVPEFIWNEYQLDQMINDRGIALDMTLVRNAIEADARSHAELSRLIQELTELDNPNSVAQMKQWLADNGMETDTLGKRAVAELLKTAPEPLGRVLSIRQSLAKSSVKKYQSMMNCVCADGRVRGLFQFYGANRTGRWCLAEDTVILTKQPDGIITEKPIQNVSIDDMVFDGLHWVEHDGVVYSGEHEVIEWDGITATESHIVYISETESITLREAKEGGIPIWQGHMT